MKRCLNTSMIGVPATPGETIGYAAKHGFAACDIPIRALQEATASSVTDGPAAAGKAALDLARELKAEMTRLGVRPGSAGGILPGNLSVTAEEWEKAIEDLDTRIAIAKELGFTRSTVVMLPFSETLPFEQCFDLHVKRLREVARPLAAAGFRLGIEYVSQKTRRAGYPHEFIYDLDGTLKLLDAVGAANLGVLLDSFHWYCAGETVAQVRALTNRQVIVVHVSDSIAGRKMDAQVAFERELPGVTGEIDLSGFLDALRSIGYDGPVTAEPMNKQLNAMDDAEGLSAVARAMAAVGL